MYDPNDEKTVLSIDEIHALQDSPEYWLGYVDAPHLLPWVHPANVTGIDLERLSRVNRARHYTWTFENVLGVDHEAVRAPDYVDDDDRVRDYLREAASQREALSKEHPDVEPISGIRHFAALLYMATHWESYFSPEEADCSRMTPEDIQGCVELYEAAFRETPHCHVRHGCRNAWTGSSAMTTFRRSWRICRNSRSFWLTLPTSPG